MICLRIGLIILLMGNGTARADWRDVLNDVKNEIQKTSGTGSLSNLSEETAVKALKQALDQAVKRSVQKLEKPGGYLNDKSVHIPVPTSLKKFDKAMRKIKQGHKMDRFVETMNRAAEQAVGKTVNILINAVTSLSIKQAVNIISGEKNAATNYFRQNSTEKLRATIKPLVIEATNAVGLTRNYKRLVAKSGVLKKYIDKDSLDLDQYITDKAIDGIFLKMEAEELDIRNNPAARTTDLLKQVFGS